HTFAPRHTPLPRPESGPLLHQAERWAALFIERDNLSVENSALGFYVLRQAAELRKLRSQVILGARHQTPTATFDEGNSAVAVPFNFEKPVRIVESLSGGSRQHGMDDRGHGPMLSAWYSCNHRGRGVRGGFLASGFGSSLLGRGSVRRSSRILGLGYASHRLLRVFFFTFLGALCSFRGYRFLFF